MATIKELEKGLSNLARDKGRDVPNVFVDLLDYIIGFFNPLQTPIEGWKDKYDSSDNERFYSLMRTYFEIMEHETFLKSWYDAWGDLFMSIHVKGNNKAQFFTPTGLCEMMASVSLEGYNGEEPTQNTSFGKRKIVGDCACGSGRNLLATKAVFDTKRWRNPYLIGEDIDPTCCKMTAINMAIHGCFGEVICHDTICEPDIVRFGYIVNETLYPFPTNIPSIRRSNDARRFYGIGHWRERRENAESREKEKNISKGEIRQLTLF